MPESKVILPTIVIAQFCCTSLWFAGNGVMGDLVINFNLDRYPVGHLTSAVQFGFIIGTLFFALFTVADRFSPSKVFLLSAIMGATFNLMTILESNVLWSLLTFRFLTGFFLAGIYPVGMKIAADHFDKGLGKSLGFLVGALVLGTAFPHFLKGFTNTLPWKFVLITTSLIATLGGLIMMLLVPDGPYRKVSQKPDLSAIFIVFRDAKFRSAAFGYFGHMWELYTFWAFVPLMLYTFNSLNPGINFNVPLLSFIIIGLGSLACVIGGYISQNWGLKNTAGTALFLSGLCCLLSPMMFRIETPVFFIFILSFWSMMVIADSPLFSTLVAQNARADFKGTALTIVNSIGFMITIVSIQLVTNLLDVFDPKYVFMILSLGPTVGLFALFRKTNKVANTTPNQE